MAATPPPADRVYSESHEWHKFESGGSGETATIGLTQFAVDQLTDVTYVGMKPTGFKFSAGSPIGEVESVKTTSDIYCAVGGEVIEVNGAVVEDPSLLNSDPYGRGWLVKVKVADASGKAKLLDAASYAKNYG